MHSTCGLVPFANGKLSVAALLCCPSAGEELAMPQGSSLPEIESSTFPTIFIVV